MATGQQEMKKPKTFKEYYANPEYRKRHLAYISEKVECPDCGFMVVRCGLARHKTSKKHEKAMALKKQSAEAVREAEKRVMEHILKTLEAQTMKMKDIIITKPQ